MSTWDDACSDCDSPYHRRCSPAPVALLPLRRTSSPASSSAPATVRLVLEDDVVTCAGCRAVQLLGTVTCSRCGRAL